MSMLIKYIQRQQKNMEHAENISSFKKWVNPHKNFLYFIPKHVSEESLMMRIHVFDKLFDHMPTLEDIEGLRLLPFGGDGHPPAGDKLTREALSMSAFMKLSQKKDYPKEHLFYLGNVSVPVNKIVKQNTNGVLWKFLDNPLSKRFQYWQGKEYETIEEGIFKKLKVLNRVCSESKIGCLVSG